MPEQCPFVNANTPPCDPVEIKQGDEPAYLCRVCGKVTRLPEEETSEEGMPMIVSILLAIANFLYFQFSIFFSQGLTPPQPPLKKHTPQPPLKRGRKTPVPLLGRVRGGFLGSNFELNILNFELNSDRPLRFFTTSGTLTSGLS